MKDFLRESEGVMPVCIPIGNVLWISASNPWFESLLWLYGLCRTVGSSLLSRWNEALVERHVDLLECYELLGGIAMKLLCIRDDDWFRKAFERLTWLAMSTCISGTLLLNFSLFINPITGISKLFLIATLSFCIIWGRILKGWVLVFTINSLPPSRFSSITSVLFLLWFWPPNEPKLHFFFPSGEFGIWILTS